MKCLAKQTGNQTCGNDVWRVQCVVSTARITNQTTGKSQTQYKIGLKNISKTSVESFSWNY